jgi:hypothetical protein
MLPFKELSIALTSLISWILFNDTPSDPEGYVRDTSVRYQLLFFILLKFSVEFTITKVFFFTTYP